VPRVIPYSKENSNFRENLLKALSWVQERNDRLSVYANFSTHVKNTPMLDCQFPE
jgi:hypothetical protein